MEPPHVLSQSTEEYLADAERYEMWAVRCAGNEYIAESFRKLATEARARAALHS